MARQKKEKGEQVMDTELMEAQETLKKQIPIDEMPLETLRDYRLYNEAARKENKKMKLNRFPIKPCPVALHPKRRVIFRRNDQPHNPLPVYISDAQIHFDQLLVPGKTYDLPEYVIHYLSEKGDPQWGWVENKDGSRETKIIGKKPRFSLTPVYEG